MTHMVSLTSTHLTPNQEPRIEAPEPKYILKKMDDALRWMKHFDYRYEKDLRTFNTITDDILPTYSRHSHHKRKRVLATNPKDFRDVRFVRNPYDVPDIGGKDGDLTKYLRKIPLHNMACYATALTIAARFPDVNIVYGVYQRNAVVRQKYKGLDEQTKFYLKLKKQQQEIRASETISKNKEIDNTTGWINTNDNDWTFKDAHGALWTFHAWNEYKGIHFDPWLYRIFKDRSYGTKTWFSKNHNRFIPWQRYKLYQLINLDEYFGGISRYRNNKQETREILQHM